MKNGISIKKKRTVRGDDGHKIVSIRMKNELVDEIDRLAAEANRSRNEFINLLLEAAVKEVRIDEDYDDQENDQNTRPENE